ncbi:hypothetical protein B0H13DRAFT_2008259 [Mycena leptocephala]|nr:hypothetical protein B0H13DRAFT_2008259 [Mycena leptocephala]
MGVRLPGWGREDEYRVAAALNASHPQHSSSHPHSHTSSTSSHRFSPSADNAPDPGPWPAMFWCTHRTRFEPIRALLSLRSLPPPMTFPKAPPRRRSTRRCTRADTHRSTCPRNLVPPSPRTLTHPHTRPATRAPTTITRAWVGRRSGGRR